MLYFPFRELINSLGCSERQRAYKPEDLSVFVAKGAINIYPVCGKFAGTVGTTPRRKTVRCASPSGKSSLAMVALPQWKYSEPM